MRQRVRRRLLARLDAAASDHPVGAIWDVLHPWRVGESLEDSAAHLLTHVVEGLGYFGDVTDEHARREGEGDSSLAHWRRAHQEFFHRSSATGERVDEDTMVVLERFEVLVPAEARRAARRNGLA